MAKITTKGNAFTGHIGATAFVKGEGATEQPTALAYFRRHPDKFDVAEDDQAEQAALEAAAEADRLAAEKAEAERLAAEQQAAQDAEAARLAALEGEAKTEAPAEKPKRTRSRKPKADDHQE